MCKLKEPAMGYIHKLWFYLELQLSSQKLHSTCSLGVEPSSAVTPDSVKSRCCLYPGAFELTPALYSCTKRKKIPHMRFVLAGSEKPISEKTNLTDILHSCTWFYS